MLAAGGEVPWLGLAQRMVRRVHPEATLRGVIRTVPDLLELDEPVGELEPTTMLGRDAWRVTVAPVDDAGMMRDLVIDSATSLVLRQYDPSADGLDELVELAVGEPLDVTLFTFGGPARSAEEARSAGFAAHEADGDRRRAWFTRRVTIAALRAEVVVDLAVVWVHTHDDRTGAFEASLEVRGGSHAGGSLTRRPWSAAPWPLRWRRWTTGGAPHGGLGADPPRPWARDVVVGQDD